MEKIETIITTIEKNYHQFYCDECGSFIGESFEYEDGYYQEQGEYTIKTFIEAKDTWFKLRKCYCDKCKDKFTNNFVEILENLGFKPNSL